MKKSLNIPSSIGYCKNCFRQRREGSAFCGQCQKEPNRTEVYFDEQKNFPLIKEVKKLFPIDSNTIFTYGDTIYAQQELTSALVAHELTHVFQQSKLGVEKWWKKYLVDKKFRLVNEAEAYHNQYLCHKRNDRKGVNAIMNTYNSAKELSGKLYGNIISFEGAKDLIKNLYESK